MVLLPTERVPLHIFEPRYHELIGECVAQDREFGLVYADDDGIQAVGTRAKVIEVVRLPDGRLSIVVEGGQRFRLVELTSGRSFHTGQVEMLGDVPGPGVAGSRGASAGAVSRGDRKDRLGGARTRARTPGAVVCSGRMLRAGAGREAGPAAPNLGRRAAGSWCARFSNGQARRQSDSTRSTSGRRETAASTRSAGRYDRTALVDPGPHAGRRGAAGTMTM